MLKALFLALVFLPTAAQAAPFMPFFTQGEFLSAQFQSSGTDSICLQCNDLDPLNDFRATVGFLPTFGASSSQLTFWGGGINFSGTTATDLPGLNEPFFANVRLTMRDFSNPDEYPEPSITLGQVFGFLQWAGEGMLTFRCCFGQLNGVNFQPGGLEYLNSFPFSAGGRSAAIDIHGPTIAQYTPAPTAVPEPASLLLVGAGLLALKTRRFRA